MLGRPLPAALAGLTGHLVMDMTPHRDPELDASYVIDGLLGAVVLSTVACSSRLRKSDGRRGALWGAAFAALPDTELLAKLFVDIDEEDYLFPTHNGRLPHPQTHGLASNLSQVTLLIVSASAALLSRRRRRRRSGHAKQLMNARDHANVAYDLERPLLKAQ